jgi:hypothetical protein
MSLIKQHFWEQYFSPEAEEEATIEELAAVYAYYEKMKEKMEQQEPSWEEELLYLYAPLIEEGE